MRGNLPAVVQAAINPSAECGNDENSTAVCGSDTWLPTAAGALLGKDAGLHLHYITGFPERSCYYYAAGKRQAPGDFIRALLRSDGGWQWLAALMDDAEPQWWADIQRARLDSELLRRLIDDATKQ